MVLYGLSPKTALRRLRPTLGALRDRRRHGRRLLVARPRVLRADLEGICEADRRRASCPSSTSRAPRRSGLTNLIIAEARRPRCDLFWNNEILNTLRLKEKGLLAPFQPAHAGDLPGDVQGQGRNLVRLRGPGPDPDRQHQARRRGRPAQGNQGPARSRSGRERSASPSRSSARRPRTPPACSPPGATRRPRRIFRDLKANGVQVFSGNKQVATAVGSGQIAFGLTDTDDAMGEVDAGSPVAIIYPDREAGRTRHAVHPQHPGDHQGIAPPEGGRGPGRLPAQPEDRGGSGQRPERPDPSAQEHRGPRPGSRRPRPSTPWKPTSRRRRSSGTGSPHSWPPNSRANDLNGPVPTHGSPVEMYDHENA